LVHPWTFLCSVSQLFVKSHFFCCHMEPSRLSFTVILPQITEILHRQRSRHVCRPSKPVRFQ
jgi:hypothetical protein